MDCIADLYGIQPGLPGLLFLGSLPVFLPVLLVFLHHRGLPQHIVSLLLQQPPHRRLPGLPPLLVSPEPQLDLCGGSVESSEVLLCSAEAGLHIRTK